MCISYAFLLIIYIWTKGRVSSVGIATRYELDSPGDGIPVGARFSAPVQTGPGTHPASYTMGNVSFLGVKRPGRGSDHPSPYLARMIKEGRTTPQVPSWPSWLALRRPLPLPSHYRGNVWATSNYGKSQAPLYKQEESCSIPYYRRVS